VNQVDQLLRQVATVNLTTLMADTTDPDPFVRDLATFGLAFVADPQATARLTELAAHDASPQVRGTAGIALAIQGKGVDLPTLASLLRDPNSRIQGAGALVAGRSIKREDPQATSVLPLLLLNLKSDNAWTRVNTAAAISVIAPGGSVAAADALIDVYKAEKEQRIAPVYLQSLKVVTGVDAKEIGPFEDWLRKQPPQPPLPPPPEIPLPPGGPVAPLPPAAPAPTATPSTTPGTSAATSSTTAPGPTSAKPTKSGPPLTAAAPSGPKISVSAPPKMTMPIGTGLKLPTMTAPKAITPPAGSSGPAPIPWTGTGA
jgi:hypothetical protein